LQLLPDQANNIFI